jgi:Ca2+-binding EF-hand superfamily protein
LVNRVSLQICCAVGLAIGAFAPADGLAEAIPATPGPGRQVLMFDRFVGSSGPVCLYRPAAECVDAGWTFADRDRDGGLSVEELQEVRDGLKDWSVWRAPDLTHTERSLLALGFLMVDTMGVQRLHAIYDSDHDGQVGRDELLADVQLDQRPLGEVLLDREAVDRAAIAARLGLPPALVERLEP